MTRTNRRRFPVLIAAMTALALAGAALALLFSTVQAQEGSAPAKPTGLTATASHDSVTLTWDDPQDDSITGYIILRRNRDTDAQGQFTELVADTGSAATATPTAAWRPGLPTPIASRPSTRTGRASVRAGSTSTPHQFPYPTSPRGWRRRRRTTRWR